MCLWFNKQWHTSQIIESPINNGCSSNWRFFVLIWISFVPPPLQQSTPIPSNGWVVPCSWETRADISISLVYFSMIFLHTLINWCLTPTLAVVQLYRGVIKFYIILDIKNEITEKYKKLYKSKIDKIV